MSRLPCPQQHIAQVPEADRDKCKPYSTLDWSAYCAVPNCLGEATEEHHCLPKWFTRGWKERDYALLYEQVVRVKVPVCHECHVELTENRSRFEFTPESGFAWTWLGAEEVTPRQDASRAEGDAGVKGGPLAGRVDPNPHSSAPSPDHNESGLTEGEATPPGWDKAAEGEADLSPALAVSPSVNPGQSCPACHRRIPYPKVETSPTSAVWSMRMPSDAKEDFRAIVHQLAEHLGAGEERYGAYKAMLTAAYWALQVAPERVLEDIGERVA